MGSKTRLSSFCTKRGDDTMNLVMSHKIKTRLAHPNDNEKLPPIIRLSLTCQTTTDHLR